MPFPSTGCQTCKDRRIKCDETRPVCQRCLKSKRTCYGMPVDRISSIMHSENAFASGSRSRPRGPRTIQVQQPPGNISTAVEQAGSDLRAQAIAYYLHEFLKTPKNLPDIMKLTPNDFVPDWLSNPVISLAISAMALAILSRKQDNRDAAVESSICYQQALESVQTAISTLTESNVEGSLISIFFMSRYENVVHQPLSFHAQTSFTANVKGFSHNDGALGVLKFWKDHLSQGHTVTSVIKHSRRYMIKAAMMRNRKPPEWMLNGKDFGEHGIELEYDSINVRLLCMRHRLSELFKETLHPHHTSPELMAEVQQLTNESREIDIALQSWMTHFPNTWAYKQHTMSSSQPWPTPDFFSPQIHVFLIPAYACVWNRYYSTRMLNSSTYLQILDNARLASAISATEEYSRHLSIITLMADEMASNLPSSLHRVKLLDNSSLPSQQDSIELTTSEDVPPYIANVAIWPLCIAASLGNVNPAHSAWFKTLLSRLGRIIGDGVVERADTDNWLEL